MVKIFFLYHQMLEKPAIRLTAIAVACGHVKQQKYPQYFASLNSQLRSNSRNHTHCGNTAYDCLAEILFRVLNVLLVILCQVKETQKSCYLSAHCFSSIITLNEDMFFAGSSQILSHKTTSVLWVVSNKILVNKIRKVYWEIILLSQFTSLELSLYYPICFIAIHCYRFLF